MVAAPGKAARRGVSPTILLALNVAAWSIAILIFFWRGATLTATATLILALILLWPHRPSDWASAQPPPLSPTPLHPPGPDDSPMFITPYSSRLMRHLPWALSVSLLTQWAAVLQIGDHPAVALLIAVAALILYWRGIPWVQHEPGLTVLRITLSLMVIGFVALALLARGGSGSSTGAGRAGSAETRPDDPGRGALGGDFTGVILIPEAQKTVTLVPPLPALPRDLFDKPEDQLLSIPFFGVYWFFRPPDSRPPPTSITLRGKPEDLRFRSVGRAPLKMEAHQNLGKLFNTGCCSAVKVEIHNAEDHPVLTAIELVLANSTASPGPGVAAESLGTQVASGSERELLTFPMPSSGLQQFDDLTVRILRGQASGNTSARISIERFIFIPRGH